MTATFLSCPDQPRLDGIEQRLVHWEKGASFSDFPALKGKISRRVPDGTARCLSFGAVVDH
jgi:hypothetical protein